MKSNINSTRRSIDIFSKLLASENITVIHDTNAKTASFNPSSRTLTFPTFGNKISKECYIGFAIHEVSHALWTDKDEWADLCAKYGRSLANILEDARIEKLAKRKFPGSKKFFTQEYRELTLDHNFFGTQKSENPFDFNHYGFLDRINCYYKLGNSAEISWSKSEANILSKIDKMETMKDVGEVCKLLKDIADKRSKTDQHPVFDFSFLDLPVDEFFDPELSDESDEFPANDGPEGDMSFNEDDSEDGDVFGDSDDSDSEDGGSEADDSDDSDSDSDDSDSDDSDDSDSDDSDSASGDANEDGAGTGDKDEIDENDVDISQDSLDESEAQEFQDKAFDELSTGRETTAFVEHTNDIPDLVIPWTEFVAHEIKTGFNRSTDVCSYIEFEASVKDQVSKMASAFNRKRAGAVRKRTSFKKSGTLDTNRMIHYKFDENIFQKKRFIRKGQNHGVVLFIDCSSSMDGRTKAIADQALLMSAFCRKIKIPFCVYFWSDSRPIFGISPTSKYKPTYSQKTIISELLSSDMSTSEFNLMASKILDNWYSLATGGTPLAPTLFHAMPAVARFKASKNLDIVNILFFSDGDGYGSFSDEAGHASTIIDKQTGQFFNMRDMKASFQSVSNPKYEKRDKWGRIKGWQPHKSQDSNTQMNLLAQVYKDRFNVNFTHIFMSRQNDIDKQIWTTLFNDKQRNSLIEGLKTDKVSYAKSCGVTSFDQILLLDGYDLFSGNITAQMNILENDSPAKMATKLRRTFRARNSSTVFATLVAESVA